MTFILLIVVAALVGFCLFFGLLWLFVTQLIMRLAGWGRLEQRYPAREQPVLLRLTGETGMMGSGTRLGGVLTLTATPAGLEIEIARVMAMFQKPVLIPWSELQVDPAPAPRAQRWGGPWTRLLFGTPPQGELTLRQTSWEALARAGRQIA